MSYPHPLAYLNDFVGESRNGYHHLLGSSFGWRHDVLCLKSFPQQLDSPDLYLVMSHSYPLSELDATFSAPQIIFISESTSRPTLFSLANRHDLHFQHQG